MVKHPSDPTLTYLAQPYWHSNPLVRQQRVEIGAAAAAFLMQGGWRVFAPVQQGDTVRHYLPSVFVHDHRFWMEQDLPMLEALGHLHLLPLPGWRESRGLAEELKLCRDSNIPVRVLQSAQRDTTLENIQDQEIAYNNWAVSFLATPLHEIKP
jgi:hypothetical protein